MNPHSQLYTESNWKPEPLTVDQIAIAIICSLVIGYWFTEWLGRFA